MLALDEYEGWYPKVGSRFKPELLEEAMKAPPDETMAAMTRRLQVKIISEQRMLELVQAANRGDPDWK
jgi:hypothetical protein